MTTQGHARHMMTSPVLAVGPEDELEAVARLLAQQRIGGVPVVDSEQRVVGVVSELDLMQSLLADGSLKRPVKDLMSSSVKSVNEFDTTDAVMGMFRGHRIHHLPVLRDGRLVGMITPSDVIRFVAAKTLPGPDEAG